MSEKLSPETGYYGIYDTRVKKFILGIQEVSPTKAKHKLNCKVNIKVIEGKSWVVKAIREKHQFAFHKPLKWKGVNLHAKENQQVGE